MQPFRRLLDAYSWVNGDPEIEGVAEYEPGREAITTDTPVDPDLNLVSLVTPERNKASDVKKVQIKKFINLLKAGEKPGTAAWKLHSSVRDIMDDPLARQKIKSLIEQYTIPDTVRKLLVKALTNKIMIEQSSEDPKLALDAAKLAAADPEVGLMPQQGGININIGDLSGLLDRATPIPGLESLAPPAIEGYVDVSVVGEIQSDEEKRTENIERAGLLAGPSGDSGASEPLARVEDGRKTNDD